MNRYEAVLVDKMVDLRKTMNMAADGGKLDVAAQAQACVFSLLDCIADFREPPTSEPLESGCGRLVSGE